ncbi:MAG: tRNA methyl transferase PRC-barrel domain-containing protein, partial [Sciscionella sp.]
DTTKPQVRAEAQARGFFVAAKPDSHDICFIPDGDTKAFVESRITPTTGELVDDESGAVLGQHSGVHGFTVGQRKGLGIQAPAGDGRPRYVLSLEPVSGTVRVGSRERLAVCEIVTDVPRFPAGEPLSGSMECSIQVRAHGGTADVVAELEPERMTVRLNTPLHGVAPGQTAVLYAGDRVLAAAHIERTA